MDIQQAIKTHPHCFTPDDITKINMNAQFFNK
jgi:hypothetical protein